jgi:predicted TIM-barrel fold metal-dependent hydrolase
MISSDSHLVEYPTLWEERLPREFRERGPRVVPTADGKEWWYVDGRKTQTHVGTQAGKRFAKDPSQLVTAASFSEVRPGAYDPALFIKESMDDGIEGSVVYPSEGLVLYSVADSALCSAACRVYNDYAAEFCSYDRARLKGIGLINVDDPGEAGLELRRCRDLGLVGALIPVAPQPSLRYDQDDYEPFWATAAELGMPLSLHTATQRADPRTGAGGVPLDVQNVPARIFVLLDVDVRASLADLIFSGVFERHPGLRVGTVEHELGWIPYFLQQLDYTYTDRPARGSWYRYKDKSARPSDFFHSNVFCSFQEDSVGVRERQVIGIDNLMWGSDYPHTESTFPRSREVTAAILNGVTDADKEKILYTNAKALYGFTV